MENKPRRRRLLNASKKELHEAICNENWGDDIAANMRPRGQANARVNATGRNHREAQLADALDMKRNLDKIIKIFDKLDKGKIDTQGAIQEISLDAIRQLTYFLYNDRSSEKTKLDAAKYIMGVAGMVPVQKHAVASVDASASKEQLLSLIAGNSGVLKEEGIEIVDDRGEQEFVETAEVVVDADKAE